MSWIAQRKSKGKFYGAATGLFLAATWGHWHDRILRAFRFHFPRGITQFGIVIVKITFNIQTSMITFDYLYSGRRYGAN